MRPLLPEEHGDAVETLALAFDDDPMFRFLLPGDEERHTWIRIVMAGMINIGTRKEGVSTTDGVRGVIGVVAPGRDRMPVFDVLGFLFKSSRRPKLRWPSGHLRRSSLALLSLMGRLHIKEPHYYVQVLGVHPAHQGKGVGRALLEPITRMADRDGVSAYLETTKESNVGLYRHFGFEVMAEVALATSDGRFPPLWAMRRAHARV